MFQYKIINIVAYYSLRVQSLTIIKSNNLLLFTFFFETVEKNYNKKPTQLI